MILQPALIIGTSISAWSVYGLATRDYTHDVVSRSQTAIFSFILGSVFRSEYKRKNSGLATRDYDVDGLLEQKNIRSIPDPFQRGRLYYALRRNSGLATTRPALGS